MSITGSPADTTDRLADAIAERLRPIWRRVFGPKGRDNGAHIMRISIGIGRMTRFIDTVETELDIRIPITALMQLGTIEALAAAIAQARWPEPSALLRLRDGDPEQTLYIVAAGTGLVLELCDLAALVRIPGQIYALQLPGLDGETPPLTSIAAIARHYAQAIARRPNHACHLIGYSFGGLVCVEIARLLNPATHPVGLVGLIDTTCYETYWPRREWLRVAARRGIRRVAEMRHMSPLAALGHLGSRTMALKRHVERRASMVPKVTRSVYYVGGLTPHLQSVRDASIVAFESHRPRVTTAALTLFQSEQGDQHACDPGRLWRHLAPRLSVIRVPGSHTSMLRRPHVESLARVISGCVVWRGEGQGALPPGPPLGP